MPYVNHQLFPTSPDPVQIGAIGVLGDVNDPSTVWTVAVGRASLWTIALLGVILWAC